MTTTLNHPPLQRLLPIFRGRPNCLARMEAVIYVLGLDEFRIADLIADHELVAFDLRGDGAEKSLPCVWSQSIRAYKERAENGCTDALAYNGAATALAISDIFPERRDALRLTEVTMALGIKRRHVHKLLTAHLLMSVPGTGNHVWQAPQLTRASVVKFLSERRM